MANKRLSLQDIELMKSMVKQGVAPEDIAKHFSIAISSVHNYKARFKAEGLNFPNVRGKRPTGSVELPSKKVYQIAPSDEPVVSTDNKTTNSFTVNGILVQVTGTIKSVNITQNSFEVKF